VGAGVKETFGPARGGVWRPAPSAAHVQRNGEALSWWAKNEGIGSMSWGRSTRLMTVIDLQEAKANLEQHAVECQTAPVVVTRDGQPIFELLPIRPDDSEFLEELIAKDPSFRDLVERAREDVRSGRVSSIESVRERLLGSPD
jgi:antitoxin (DNA-binding transcriptional repressor) of toxin-antitoxin stability system